MHVLMEKYGHHVNHAKSRVHRQLVKIKILNVELVVNVLQINLFFIMGHVLLLKTVQLIIKVINAVGQESYYKWLRVENREKVN